MSGERKGGGEGEGGREEETKFCVYNETLHVLIDTRYSQWNELYPRDAVRTGINSTFEKIASTTKLRDASI